MFKQIATAIFCFGMAFNVSAADAAANSTLSDLHGQVSVNQDGNFAPAKPDMRLKAGDKVMVRGKSSAAIVFDDQCRVDIAENKVVTVSELSACACRLLTEQKSNSGVPESNAALRQIKGAVLVNEGREFSPAKLDMRLKPGDRIMAQAASGATIVFDDSCKLEIDANKLVTVPDQSVCKCGLLVEQGLTPGSGSAIGGTVISNANGAIIAGGIIAIDLCLTYFCHENDDDDTVSP